MIAQFVVPFDKLHIEDVDGVEGILEQPLSFYSADLKQLVIAPAYMVTDFASIPRGLWNVFPKRGKHDRAAVLHDAGYRGYLEGTGGRQLMLPKSDIDRLFNEAMGVCGVGAFARWSMYRAVSWFGKDAFQRARRVKTEEQRVGDEAV